MLLSAVLFAVGTRWYVRLNPAGSMLGRGLRIIYHSLRSHAKKEINMGGSFLDRAKSARNLANGDKLFTETDVDSMKIVAGLLPVFFSFIIFWYRHC